ARRHALAEDSLGDRVSRNRQIEPIGAADRSALMRLHDVRRLGPDDAGRAQAVAGLRIAPAPPGRRQSLAEPRLNDVLTERELQFFRRDPYPAGVAARRCRLIGRNRLAQAALDRELEFEAGHSSLAGRDASGSPFLWRMASIDAIW